MTKSQKFTRRRAVALGLGTFASVGVWQGLSKFNEYNKHAQLLAARKDENFTVVGSSALKERAAAKKLIYGAATGYSDLRSEVKFATSFRQECAMLMAEGDLLWCAIRPSPSDYDFTRADWLAQYAQTHKMLFGATHLVWHDCLPPWFKETVNHQNAKEIMLNHVKTVAGHFAGKIHLWTVVNEAIDPADGGDGLRKTPWLEFIGPEFIEMAFHAAAEADPNALLVYNDWGVEFDTSYQDARRKSILKLLERLKSQGVPVDAFGMQSHLRYDTNFNPKKLQNFLADVADLGLKILVTEMDVSDKNLPKDVNTRDRTIAGVYEDFLSVVLAEPAVIAVITWGLSDKHTWLSWNAPRQDGASVRPLPLDAQLNRKLAWNAIARAFDRAPKRRSSSMLSAWKNLY